MYIVRIEAESNDKAQNREY